MNFKAYFSNHVGINSELTDVPPGPNENLMKTRAVRWKALFQAEVSIGALLFCFRDRRENRNIVEILRVFPWFYLVEMWGPFLFLIPVLNRSRRGAHYNPTNC